MKSAKSRPKIAVRCVHAALVPVADLKPNPRNPNVHPEAQIELLAKIIRHQGWRSPVVVSKRSGFIVAGHARREAALRLGCEVVPVDWQEFGSDEDEWAHLLADNRLAELAETDEDALKGLLVDLGGRDFDLELAGFDAEAVGGIVGIEQADAEPQMDRAEELRAKWGVKAGQLWALGDHRLLCGDATKAEDVARLLDGAVPVLMVTDPPYGVEYDADWRNHAFRADGLPIAGRAIGPVENDDRADWSQAWRLFPGDVIYSWHPAGATSLVHAAALQDSGFKIRMQIIWAKNQFPIGRGDYHVKHEPCWYCVRDGKPARFTKDRTQTTLWEIDKPHKSDTGHSTQKPVECMARPMRNHDAPEVYDPFLGSGTTMVAAQSLGRKCYGIEISPAYCAVVLERMATAFPGIEIRRA